MGFTLEELLHSEKKELVKVTIDEDRRGKIIAGMGAGRDGSGCTRSMFQLAKRAAEHHPDKKVLIVDYHLTEPCLDRYFFEDPHKLQMHLDTLYKQINRDIDKGQINSNTFNLKEQNNLYLLAGTRRPFSADSFQADVLMAILAALRQLYDVVFVDCSAHIDNPATVAALLSADHILAFSNYDEDGLRFFNQYHKIIFDQHPGIQEKLVIIAVETYLRRADEIEDLSPVPVIASLPHVGAFVSTSILQSDLSGKHVQKYLKVLDNLLERLKIAGAVSGTKQKGGLFGLWPTRQSTNSNA